MTTAPHATDRSLTPDDLVDRALVADLVHRLGAALDGHDFAALGDLFTPDAEIVSPGGVATGRAAVVAQATRNHVDYTATQHLFGNLLIDLDGDRAEARADMVARLVREGLVPALTLGAAYRWRLIRTPAGWRFAGMRITAVWRVEAQPAAVGT